ncbi:MAG: DHA2 family efflux MFS transporter permease subunit [Bacteroidota bacterium]|nr:DHA2 family efflux MFS transporter permease subunit [Bacteroidota bacterium]
MNLKKLSPVHHFRKASSHPKGLFDSDNPYYKWLLLLNVMIGTFMAVLDATIINVSLPKIMSAFGVGIDKIEWVITAYMLATAVMLPTSTWMADKFGYKRIYFLGLFGFTFGSFLCGISPSENFLIFARVIQGLGAGCIMPVGMAIVTREFPPNQRGIALGFWSIASAASVSFGPLIGGYLIDNFSWQLIFDVNIPIGIFGIIATLIVQKEFKNPSVGKFDPVGFISVSIFLPVLLYALSQGNAQTNSGGWTAPVILACFGISAIAIAVFLTSQLAVSNPLLDLRLFRDYNFSISNIIMLVFSIGMFGSTFLLPLYLQNSLDYTAIQAGAVFLPVGIIQGFTAPVVGIFSDKTNPKIPVLIGVILLASSFFINSRLSYLSEHWFIMLSLYVRGFGMGILFTPLSTISMLSIPKEKIGQASGILNVIRQLGGSFGVAIFATLLTVRTEYHAVTFGESAYMNSPVYYQINQRLTDFAMKSVGSTNANAALQSRYLMGSHIRKQAFVQGVSDDFLVAGIITLLGIIPVVFLKTRRKQLKPGTSGPPEKDESRLPNTASRPES